MNWSKRGRGRRGYHHGNLREALVSAALDLIAEKGPAGFTFSEAARLAGVSAAAPYRHFADREALMADVARRGFEQFADDLATAWNGGDPDPVAALDALGRAYLAFAGRKPAYYLAMFESQLPPDCSAELLEASERAFGVLRDAAQAVCLLLPKENRPPASMVSLHFWTLAHGIASLFARGDAGRRKLPMAPEDLLEAAVLIYLQGLGLGSE